MSMPNEKRPAYARAQTRNIPVNSLNKRYSNSLRSNESQDFKDPSKPENMQPAAIIHPCRPQYRDSQKSQEVDSTPDEMFRRTDLCAWNFLFFISL